jgi:hypothetical protein
MVAHGYNPSTQKAKVRGLRVPDQQGPRIEILAQKKKKEKLRMRTRLKIFYEKIMEAGCWWLMPIILSIQEAEIRKIKVQSQPEKVVHEILS